VSGTSNFGCAVRQEVFDNLNLVLDLLLQFSQAGLKVSQSTESCGSDKELSGSG
jgi:hypothetical protein